MHTGSRSVFGLFEAHGLEWVMGVWLQNAIHAEEEMLLCGRFNIAGVVGSSLIVLPSNASNSGSKSG